MKADTDFDRKRLVSFNLDRNSVHMLSPNQLKTSASIKVKPLTEASPRLPAEDPKTKAKPAASLVMEKLQKVLSVPLTVSQKTARKVTLPIDGPPPPPSSPPTPPTPTPNDESDSDSPAHSSPVLSKDEVMSDLPWRPPSPEGSPPPTPPRLPSAPRPPSPQRPPSPPGIDLNTPTDSVLKKAKRISLSEYNAVSKPKSGEVTMEGSEKSDLVDGAAARRDIISPITKSSAVLAQYDDISDEETITPHTNPTGKNTFRF